MQTSICRRQFLKTTTVLAALPAGLASTSLAAGAPAGGPPTEGQGLTTYQLGPQIWIRWNNRLLTCYRAHRSQKYPYLYPLAGPVSGLSLTAETALPFPHHRSLFFGCDRVNGGNYWQEGYEKGQILSAGPRLGQAGKESVEILDACEWQKPGEPVVMKDERKLTVTVAGPRLTFIDWEILWQAVVDVQVQKTNHALFSMRAASDLTPLGGARS
jgi:hypothetical protein